MHPLRKLLIRNRTCYPFNDSYDKNAFKHFLVDYIKGRKIDRSDVKLIETSIVANLFNSIFTETFEFFKKSIYESNLSIDEIRDFSLVFVNRQLMILNKLLDKKFQNQNENYFEENLEFKINSIDPTIGEIDAQSALESSIDALNILLNYANYFKNSPPPKNQDIEEIKSGEKIKQLNIASTIYYVLKATYDQCIWNDGYVRHSEENKEIKFCYLNQENLLLKKIGFIRLNRNVFTFSQTAKKILEKDDVFTGIIKTAFRKKKKAKRIKNVRNENGFITYKLADGIDKNELDWELKNDSAFLAYYPFIEDVQLPKLESISLNDLKILFDILQHLFRKASENIPQNDEVYNLQDFYKFPFKIKIKDLKVYLSQRTTYTTKQINQFLELLCNKKDKRINFWDYPFIAQDDTYFFPLITIIHPINLVLTDRWLEDSGFNLDERGIYLEKYIKKIIEKELTIKNFEFSIPEESIYKLPNNKFEEIDLIVNLKYICIIAEVKCIKFSLESRDEHNALKRLRDGAEQVIRKSKFISDNKKYFQKSIGNLEGKEIVNLVITNYPSYTGYQFNKIPLVDFFLLDAYINSGVLVNRRFSRINEKVLKDEIISERKFYNNEKEFCLNLKKHMEQSPTINLLKQQLEIRHNKMSSQNMNYNIYAESAEYKNNKG